MNKKLSAKKLYLNKKTIANLSDLEMKYAQGGLVLSEDTFCLVSLDSLCRACTSESPCTSIDVFCLSRALTCTCP